MSASKKRPAAKKPHRSSTRNLRVPVVPTRIIDVVDHQRYTPFDAAQYLGVSPATLGIWRCVGRYNLPFIKMGSRVQYLGRDLRKFVESRRRESTPEASKSYV
jgi:hypothetical protein